jgi:hypothetical protein
LIGCGAGLGWPVCDVKLAGVLRATLANSGSSQRRSIVLVENETDLESRAAHPTFVWSNHGADRLS